MQYLTLSVNIQMNLVSTIEVKKFITNGLNVDCHIFSENKSISIKTKGVCARIDKKFFIEGLNT